MNNFWVMVFVSVMLMACSKDSLTVEQKVLMGTFASYQSALVYDEVCNGTDPKSRYDFGKIENVNLIGNEQMLVARLGAIQHLSVPDKSIDELVKALHGVAKKFQETARQNLDVKGCDSPEAKSTATAYAVFSSFSPAQLSSVVDGRITEQGGVITLIENIEDVKEDVKSAKDKKQDGSVE